MSTEPRPVPRPRKEALLLPLSQLPAGRTDWLWPGRIACGTLCLLDGDPGEGKSLLTLDLAARLTTVRPWPDDTPGPGPAGVVLLSAEDHPAQTIVPRLRAAGADLGRVHVLRVRPADGSDRLPTLPDDVDLLRDAVTESAARLVIVDPFLAFLAANVHSLNDQHIRRALDPLSQLAAGTGVAVLLVRHRTKYHRDRPALLHGTGATAIVGAARTALLVGRTADDPERRLLVGIKNNLGEMPVTLAYHLVTGADEQAVVAWDGATPQTAADLVRTRGPGEPIEAAQDFLTEVLTDGPVARESVLRQAHARGLADRTLQRAKAALDVRSECRHEHGHNVWYWILANEDAAAKRLEELWAMEAKLRS